MNPRLWYDRETREIMCEMFGTVYGAETFSLSRHLMDLMTSAMSRSRLETMSREELDRLTGPKSYGGA